MFWADTPIFSYKKTRSQRVFLYLTAVGVSAVLLCQRQYTRINNKSATIVPKMMG